MNGAAHCGVGLTVGGGAVGVGFWYDANENGSGVTVGLTFGGGGFFPIGIEGDQRPVEPLFAGPYG